MCQPRMAVRSSILADCNCGCCGCEPSFRSFLTTEEKLERLKTYRDQLEKELAGVQERIGEIKKA
jgi:hypothetical protein